MADEKQNETTEETVEETAVTEPVADRARGRGGNA